MARDRSKREQARSLRLFVAFDIGDAAIAAVDAAIGPWRARFPEARWVPAANWHVTLKFLGPTYPRLLPWVRERIAAAASGLVPFRSALTTLGSFPTPTRGRVLWVGLDDRAGRMAEVAQALDTALSAEIRQETRPFSAHLTVARSDPPLRLPEGFVGTPVEQVEVPVDRVVLFRSQLRRPAPIYEPLADFGLGPA